MIWKFSQGILPAALCCVLSNNAFAQSSESTESSVFDRISGSIAVDYSRNAYDSDSYKARRSTGISYGLSYTTENDIALGVNGRTQYSYDQEIGWFPQDYWLSISKSNLYQPTEWLTIGGDIRAAIPVSEYSDKTKLNTAVRGAVTFAVDLSAWAEGLSFTFQPRLLKNFHQYKTAGGRNLVEYDAGAYYGLAYDYQDWTFSASAINNHTWTYKGNYNHPSISHQEYIGYQVTSKVSLGVGHTNSVSFFDPSRGPSPVSRLLDYKHSTFYALAVYSF
ncbi:hypothetical protein K6Y31_01550 [Motilimonas cestriensis]|uniref:Outer membrane protein n=1 Tax=Motilimonas cestriensis TaxID=2742685 RepID=A0ABS8W4T0_9GAMM|nr:hypothetical protein [Motilimonas cestriensis]MCE2593500.1 hypothetical protein [Motilimonas cestriensis]